MRGISIWKQFNPQKINVMVEGNREREDIGSSKRLKGSEESNEKKLTYAEVMRRRIIVIGIAYG